METTKAWQCIGCGRIEAPQTCIGVCQDRKVEFVYAYELAEAQEQLQTANRRASALRALVQQIAWSTPRDGAWERSYRTLQARARQLLDEATTEQATT